MKNHVKFFITAFIFIILKNSVHGFQCLISHSRAFTSSLICFNTLVEDNDIDKLSIRKTVPTVKTSSHKISVTNPFGLAVKSITDAVSELQTILEHKVMADSFLHLRVEYLSKILESTYVPIQTIPFLNLALQGKWKLLYTNVLTPKANQNLDLDIHQCINTNDSVGRLINEVSFNYHIPTNDIISSPDVSTRSIGGDFNIVCDYSINSKGAQYLTLQEHILQPNDIMDDDQINELLMSFQRTMPFEFFDPDDAEMSHTFISPELRISKMSGEKFHNVFNVFKRIQ